MVTLVIGFLGALIGAASKIGVEEFRHLREAKALAAMLAGEIEALLDIVRLRQHYESYERELQSLRAGSPLKAPGIIPGSISEEHPILCQNLNRIGVLGHDLASRISRYYIRVAGLRYDVANFSEGSREDNIRMLEQTLLVWRETTSLAEELVLDLKKFSVRPVWGHLLESYRLGR